MGRPKVSRNKPKQANGGATTDAEPGIGHNGDLSDDERQALFFDWKRKYETALAAKKDAVEALKRVGDAAKAELGPRAVVEIKLAIQAETPEGEAEIKARLESEAKTLRWIGLPIGAQGSLFPDVDMTPAVEKARADGKRAGLAGEPCQPPYDPSVPQHQEYITGWHEGQAIHLRAGIRPMPTQDAAPDDGDGDVRPRFMREDENEAESSIAPSDGHLDIPAEFQS